MTENNLKELDLEIRVSKLNMNALRAAIFSVENTDDLETIVQAGERYQTLASKMKKKKYNQTNSEDE